MTSSLGLQQALTKDALRNTADKFIINFLVYGMEILLVQSNASLIKLVFWRGIVLMLFI